MARPQLTDSEVFQIAGYAHSKLAPLMAEAQAIEPSIEFKLELMFGNSEVDLGEGHIDALAHWARKDMFLYSTWLHTKNDIDELAVNVRASIEKLKAESNDLAYILAHAF